MSDIRITAKQRMALTADELALLDGLVKSGDRASYDMAYYAMTGVSTVALEARIATFSGPVGGVAFSANRLLQEWYGPGTGANPQYPGIYYLSQKVALRGFDFVTISTKDSSEGGYVDYLTYLSSARSAWADERVEQRVLSG